MMKVKSVTGTGNFKVTVTNNKGAPKKQLLKGKEPYSGSSTTSETKKKT